MNFFYPVEFKIDNGFIVRSISILGASIMHYAAKVDGKLHGIEWG